MNYTNDRLIDNEAWVWCTDCNCKIYSTDGNKDILVKCPTKTKCKEENERYK